VDNGGW